MRAPPLRKKDIRAWLMRHELDETVGIAKDDKVCPLACYLRDQRGYWAPGVRQGAWTPGGIVPFWFPLPKWAQSFVDRIDTRGHRGVTAEEALAELEASL